MSFVLEPSLSRLPEETLDRADWTPGDVANHGFVVRAFEHCRAGLFRYARTGLHLPNPPKVERITRAGDRLSFRTEGHSVRWTVERTKAGPVMRITVKSAAGTPAVAEFPMLVVDLDNATDAEIPVAAERIVECALEQLSCVSLVPTSSRWRDVEDPLEAHLRRLVASGRLEGFDNPSAMAVFRDGAPARSIVVFDLMEDDCGHKTFVRADGADVCPSPGHARAASFVQTSSDDGVTRIIANIRDPITTATSLAMPDDPVALIRLLREDRAPGLVEVEP